MEGMEDAPDVSLEHEQSVAKTEEDKNVYVADNQPFEAIINEAEMEFIERLMPKGYWLTTAFRSTRPRVAKYVHSE